VEFAALAKEKFVASQETFQRETNNAEAAWRFARACFDLGEFATNSSQRANIAEQGISASRSLIARQPSLAAAHYYLAMNLGQLARTRTLGALRLVSQMEIEFTRARTLDENFDFAGPDRNLGLLYLEAPTIASVGNRLKARVHLRRSVELAPDYPDNRLNLIEALWKLGDRVEARREFKALEEVWPKMLEKFTGDEWAASRGDWSKRFDSMKRKMEATPKLIESPRAKP